MPSNPSIDQCSQVEKSSLTKENVDRLALTHSGGSKANRSVRSYASSVISDWSICYPSPSVKDSFCDQSVVSYREPNQSTINNREEQSIIENPQIPVIETPHKRQFSKMASLIAAGAGLAISTFFFKTIDPIQPELQDIERLLNENLYCQPQAVADIVKYFHAYTTQKYEGPIILFLSGPQGVGKTHALNAIRSTNKRWPMLVATHEQGYLNQMSEEDFTQKAKSSLLKGFLNVIAFDDIVSFKDRAVFIQEKIYPLLESLKSVEETVFVIITLNDDRIPDELQDYKHHIIKFDFMTKECVEKCISTQLAEIGLEVDDMSSILGGITFGGKNGITVSYDGCKSVPKSIAIYKEHARETSSIHESRSLT